MVLNKFYKNKTAFSFTELALVMIVIAIIIFGVSTAKKVLESSRLARAQSITQVSPIHGIDNLVLWLDATAPNAFLEEERINNNDISIWHDVNPLVRIKNHAKQDGSANVPTYHKDAFNGLPALYFNSTTDYLIGGPLGISGDDAATIFIVFNANDEVSVNIVFGFGDSSGTVHKTKRLDIRTGNSANGWRYNSGNRIFNEDIESNKSYVSIWMNRKGASYGNHTSNINGTHQLILNGVESTEATSNNNDLIPDLSNEEYLVGTGRTSSGLSNNEYHGYIAEIIVYNRYLLKREVAEIEKYLMNKWGIISEDI